VAHTTTQPADTTMMGVVHDALRRDLARTQAALTSTPPPDDGRRQAIAAHVEWMMTFLHHHHESEDDGLWPLVRSRSPQGVALLDAMQGQHSAILPAIDSLRVAADRYGTDAGDAARTGLLAALDGLSAVLMPHLRQEEDEAMPMVSSCLSDSDWRAWDQEHNVKPKSMSQLGDEGHWLMDGLDRARYDRLVHLVPAPVRLILLKGFARRYRLAARSRWAAGTEVGPRHRPVRT
jgi:hemerythrin-like domain-containing protein